MTDARVHPATADALSPPLSSSSAKDSGEYPVPPNPLPAKPVPPPATYVVQIPREQILRYPPPENARKFQALTRRGKSGRSRCRRCCCCTLSLLAFLVIAAAISAGVLYLVFRFKSPNYAVTSLAIKGMNLTSAAPISPEFDVTIRAENPNGKIGIYYLKGSAINVFYNDVKLSHGVLPAFYQPKKEEEQEKKKEEKEEKKAEEAAAAKKDEAKKDEDKKEEGEAPAKAAAAAAAAAEAAEETKVELKKNEMQHNYFYPNYYHHQQQQQVYPQRFVQEYQHEYPSPQMFSDENPNACSVM